MAALTADKDVAESGDGHPVRRTIIDTETIRRGSLVTSSDTTGLVKAGVDEAGFTFEGLCVGFESDDPASIDDQGTGNTAGTQYAMIKKDLRVRVELAAALQNPQSHGEVVVLTDDQTVADTSSNSIAVGLLDKLDDDDSTKGFVWLNKTL